MNSNSGTKTIRVCLCSSAACAALALASVIVGTTMRAADSKPTVEFHTSDRCVACHNGMRTASGEDMSIGFDWRASMMANSSRDPYWQASVRREAIDHPESKNVIEDECAVCHMPISRYEAKLQRRNGEVFAHLPLVGSDVGVRQASDGVSCSVCHQISEERLGRAESFNGGFVVAPPQEGHHEVVLGGEVAVERRLRHAGVGDDRVDADGGDPVAVEGLGGRVEDPRAGRGRGGRRGHGPSETDRSVSRKAPPAARPSRASRTSPCR